jgi:hypothetical protein
MNTLHFIVNKQYHRCMHDIFITCTMEFRKYFPALSSSFYINYTPQYSYRYELINLECIGVGKTRKKMLFHEMNIVHIIFPRVVSIYQISNSIVIWTFFCCVVYYCCIYNNLYTTYLDTQIVDKLFKPSVLSNMFRRSWDSHMLIMQNIRKSNSGVMDIICRSND